MKNPKYQLFRGINKEYFFRLRAANGEIVLASEGYKAKAGAENGIESVRVNSPIDARYQTTDNPGSYYFNLRAANHEIIGTSETYTTSAARDHGIEVVKRIAPEAPVEDIS